jgi:hypothetical protein
VVIAPAETGFEVEIVGEDAHMIELSMDEGKKKGPVEATLMCSFRDASRQSLPTWESARADQ